MDNVLKGNELELGNFGDYLLKSRIVPEKYSRYYVRWVRRFMAVVPEKPGLTFEDRLIGRLGPGQGRPGAGAGTPGTPGTA